MISVEYRPRNGKFFALKEQLGRSLLARPIGRQAVDKNMKPLQSGSQDELIGAGVSINE